MADDDHIQQHPSAVDNERPVRGRGLAKRARRALSKSDGDYLAAFTPRARSVLVLAQEEAQQLRHNYLGTEHLLLGLLREQDGIAAQALTDLGVTYAAVRETVKKIVGEGGQVTGGERCFTPRTKKVLELAHKEAKRLRHSYVGTEHLLLGVLREGEGIAAGILTDLGVHRDQAEAEILSLLSRVGALVETRAGKTTTTVVMTRVDEQDLHLLDMLVEARVRSTRSDAASWLIHAGIEANRPLFAAIAETVTEIQGLRERAYQLAQQAQQPRSVPPEA